MKLMSFLILIGVGFIFLGPLNLFIVIFVLFMTYLPCRKKKGNEYYECLQEFWDL